MRKSSIWVLSLLLAMFLGGCSSGGGGEPEVTDPREEKFEDYPAVEAFLEKVERAHAGETVDFIGNGSTTRIWFDENGVRHFESNGPAHNKHRYTSETHPDDSYTTTYSAYADRVIDKQEEQRVDGTRVTLHDTDRDGEFDKRVTLTLTDDPEFFRVIEEESTPEGVWREVRNELVPTTVESLSEDAESLSDEAESNNADAMHALQPAMRAPNQMLGIHFVTSGHGACSPEEQSRTKEAISGILENSLACLSATRPAMAKRILDAYAGKHHVSFYCGFENDSRGNAGTKGFALPNLSKGWTCSARFPCVIKVNRDHLNHAISKDLQGTVLHELLHTLGFNNDTSPEEHGKGTDETYSCERYCAGCNGHGQGFQSSNIDCARCADTPERKMACGTKFTLPLGTPSGPPRCNQEDVGSMEFTCDGKSRIIHASFCDDTVGGILLTYNNQGRFWYCCDECPCTTNCRVKEDNNNAMPCGLIPIPWLEEVANNCDDKPPFCR